eukprot:COSAG01_NODE_4999_length_4557_cov_15.544674_5_plen_408_part_00
MLLANVAMGDQEDVVVVVSCPETGTIARDGASGPYDQPVMATIEELSKQKLVVMAFDRQGTSTGGHAGDAEKFARAQQLFKASDTRYFQVIEDTTWFKTYTASVKAQLKMLGQFARGRIVVVCIGGGMITGVEMHNMTTIVDDALHDAKISGVTLNMELQKLKYIEFAQRYDIREAVTPTKAVSLSSVEDGEAVQAAEAIESQFLGDQLRMGKEIIKKGTLKKKKASGLKGKLLAENRRLAILEVRNDGPYIQYFDPMKEGGDAAGELPLMRAKIELIGDAFCITTSGKRYPKHKNKGKKIQFTCESDAAAAEWVGAIRKAMVRQLPSPPLFRWVYVLQLHLGLNLIPCVVRSARLGRQPAKPRRSFPRCTLSQRRYSSQTCGRTLGMRTSWSYSSTRLQASMPQGI